MILISNLKKIAENIPPSVGRPMSTIPYTVRLGLPYLQVSKSIKTNDISSQDQVSRRLFYHCVKIVKFAEANIEFYKNFYKAHGFNSEQLKKWDDWQRVPIVTKSDMQSLNLIERSAPNMTGFKINTGGTSGQPLEFYLDKYAFAREWAHMHYIWKSKGYKPTHLKLTFRGKHFNTKLPLRYNAVHNEYVVNSNCSMEDIVTAVIALDRKYIIRWVHGYPSLIAEFTHAFRKIASLDLIKFSSQIYGVLLGSEYPAPIYRNVIEKHISTNIISWYGHSEMAILARETSLGIYNTFPTYGHAEALPLSSGNGSRMICTSYNNKLHPFIRYDTGDIIDAIPSSGIGLTFSIRDGRVGDYIKDRQGKKHSLTAVIFGRHHTAFALIQHIQVRERSLGEVTLIVTPLDITICPTKILSGFDFTGLDIKWEIIIVKEPIRTLAGKIRLLLT